MRHRTHTFCRSVARCVVALTGACAALASLSCTSAPEAPPHRSFAAPEEAVRALTDAVKAGNMDELRAIFGPDVQELVDTSDPATARRRREVFTAAVREKWHLVDQGTGKTLVIGNEEWPFPVPLAKDASGWRFDTAAGKEEVLARRIGRNELTVIRICHTYVAAQRLYAKRRHDGRRAGLFAKAFQSDPGRQNGLYWPARRSQKRSPLGDLVAQATEQGTVLGKNGSQPTPFHGYYFKILTAQGSAAAGGAKDYVVNGEMSGGFALVAWPAKYDVSGIMTFIVNQDDIVRQKDLRDNSDAAARTMTVYNPDASWTTAQ
jgi:Protein of unknown function (DUF2950)